jgi:proteasome lid subunit RPN8/RPN11
MPDLFKASLSVPAFIASSDDDPVGKGRDELVKLFSSPVCVVHSGPGHRPLPSGKEAQPFVQQLCGFIRAHCPP